MRFTTGSLKGILLFVGLIASADLLADDGITLWTRKPGNYLDGGDPGRSQVEQLKTDQLKFQETRLFDIQYGKTLKFKVVRLSDIIAKEMQSRRSDLALLHFENRMIVPVPGELAVAEKPEYSLWLATAVVDADTGKWSQKFPPIARPDERFRDPSPIKFSSNKIVLAQLWRPAKADPKDAFSPWKHANSLIGIEFVNQRAYYKQFLATKDGRDLEVDGWEVFQTRCQYCHGVRKVGAGYGWDFVTPLPIYEKRGVESLFLHVQVQKQDPLQMGTRMPHQPDFTHKEAEELWKWLKSVAKAKLSSYAP